MTVILHGLVSKGMRRAPAPSHDLVDCIAFSALLSPAPANLDRLPTEEIAELALHHNDVLVAYLGAAALLPLRFGAAFSTSAAACAHLTAHAQRHLAALRAIAGLTEYVVQLNITALPPPPDRQGISGKTFLTRGRDLRDMRHNLTSMRARFAQDTTAALRPLCRSCDQAGVPKPGRLLDLAFLVDRHQVPTLQQCLARLSPDAAALGLDLRLTGPWPAYSFRFEEVTHDA